MTGERLLLRVPEAAEVLALSRSRTYQLVASGVLPTVRIGRSTRIPLDGLRRWIEQQADQPSTSRADDDPGSLR